MKHTCSIKIAAAIAAITAMGMGVFAQEMSVEDSFLQESVEVQIIRETANSNDRTTQLQALDFIKQQLDAGVKSPEIRDILRDLAGQGTYRQERVNGRLANRYTEVRIRAAEYLSEFPKEQSTPLLGDILKNEPEVAVITQVVYSLQKVGAYDTLSEEMVEKYFRNYHNRKPPDNRLAVAVLNYYGSAPEKHPFMLQAVRDIASKDSNYAHNTRELAERLLKKMMDKK
ncbi:MAG: DNA alkylation repair protein [Spirochaetaceae bacterium]|jgi:DNA-binding transcriptional MerR regulator|nr:DNA alkylation repair protein [Spirochaetaceae bacterium]